jgi:hypothetical protein
LQFASASAINFSTVSLVSVLVSIVAETYWFVNFSVTTALRIPSASISNCTSIPTSDFGFGGSPFILSSPKK